MMTTVWWMKFSLSCGCCPLLSSCEWGPSVVQPGGCIYTHRASPCSVPPQAQPSRLCTHIVLAFQSSLSLLQSTFLISSGALYYFVPLSQIEQCCINSYQFSLHERTARASAELQHVWMPALAYFDLGFPHELWSFSHLYYSDSTILKKNPITFQFLLIVFNSLWKPFQLFIIHFFSAPTAEQNVFFFPALYGFSPCFDCCEAVSSWAFPPPIHVSIWQENASVMWPVRGRGRTLHSSCAFRIISSSLPLLTDAPFSTAGPQASSSCLCIQNCPVSWTDLWAPAPSSVGCVPCAA